MPYSFFDDYDACKICGFDHQWEYDEAVEIHHQILIKKARENIMENVNKNEELTIPQDPQAYVYGFAILMVVVAFIASIAWAW